MDSSSEKKSEATEASFAYLDRNTFSSEKFKIEIRGLPKFYGVNELKKLLNNKLKLKCSKIKPPKKRSEWLYVCFRSEEDRQCALTKLDGYVWKNKTLSVQPASAVPDPLVQKRTESRGEKSEIRSRDNLPKDISPEELLKANTVPLWNVPYDTQLEMKMEKMRSVLQTVGKELLFVNKMSPSIRKLLEDRSNQYSGIPCELENIRHAPEESIINGYRNKCEFTIGINEETGQKTAGFRFGSYVQGTTNVGSINDMPHVTETMKNVVQKFECFIRKSELDVYNHENHCGFWKQLMVRIGTKNNEIMVVIGVNVNGPSSEQLEDVKSSIIKFFVQEEGSSCNVASLYLQTANFANREKFTEESLHLLHGSPTIVEVLCGLKFYISPLSFFQPHTATAEMLYKAVGELTSLSSEVTVLDICCGTGTIGLCLANSGAQILGIESEAAAIKNARYNCQQNDISNCSFFHGRAEDILSSVISKASNTDIVAVVDPPRAGLHQKTIIQLRRSTNIKKLIYLSCNPEAASKNFITLGKPPSKTLLGNQFFPVKAIPVDNFPYTKHCELIIYFERYEGNKEKITL